MAGHAAETMDEYYDLKSKNTTQTVIDALNNKYDMVSEVENLEASSISVQREIDFSKYKETAEEDRSNRLSKQKAELKDQEMYARYKASLQRLNYRMSVSGRLIIFLCASSPLEPPKTCTRFQNFFK